MMRKRLEGIRQRKYTGVAELAEHVGRILTESGPTQERGTVSEVPDERTIRYYLSEGLISPAEEKQGTASIFGYLHLLQLLAVKKLQSEHLPIRKIREVVSGRSERELERLVGIEGGAESKNEALSYLEKLLVNPPRMPPGMPTPQSPMSMLKASATHDQRQYGYTEAPPGRTTGSIPSGDYGGTWERLEIEPGLELHIRGDYRPPQEARGLRRLTQAVIQAVESYARRFRK
jgi:DNA-binding transcriptional MerR regulator